MKYWVASNKTWVVVLPEWEVLHFTVEIPMDQPVEPTASFGHLAHDRFHLYDDDGTSFWDQILPQCYAQSEKQFSLSCAADMGSIYYMLFHESTCLTFWRRRYQMSKSVLLLYEPVIMIINMWVLHLDSMYMHVYIYIYVCIWLYICILM